MDEGTGTATTEDRSGKGNTGTLVNSPTWVQGVRGNALSFNGTNQYVSFSLSNLPQGSSSRSLVGWAYANSLAGTRVLFGYGAAGEGTLTGAYLSGSSLMFWRGSTDRNTGYVFSLNKWTHVVVTYDGTDGKTYVNGALQDSFTTSLNTGSAAGAIAAHGAGSFLFSGRMDDVRIYNRALTAQDVYMLYLSDNRIRNAVMRNVQFK